MTETQFYIMWCISGILSNCLFYYVCRTLSLKDEDPGGEPLIFFAFMAVGPLMTVMLLIIAIGCLIFSPCLIEIENEATETKGNYLSREKL